MPGVFLRNLLKDVFVHGEGKMTGSHQLGKDNKPQPTSFKALSCHRLIWCEDGSITLPVPPLYRLLRGL